MSAAVAALCPFASLQCLVVMGLGAYRPCLTGNDVCCREGGAHKNTGLKQATLLFFTNKAPKVAPAASAPAADVQVEGDP